MRILVFCIALVFYASIVWAAMAFFRIDNSGAKRGKAFISTAGAFATGIALWDIWNWEANALRGGLGIGLFSMALCLFWWTYFTVRSKAFSFAFSSNAPSHLVIIGPFRFIRHPFYTSYILGWSAAFLTTNTIQTFVVFATMFGIYWMAARKEEAQFMKSSLADEYSVYRSNTGVFVPRIF